MAAVKEGNVYRVTAIYESNKGSKSVDPPSGGILIAVHADDKSFGVASEVKKGDLFVLCGVSGNTLMSGAYAGFGEFRPQSTELIPVSSSPIKIDPDNFLTNVPDKLNISGFFANFEEDSNTRKVYDLRNVEITSGYVGTGFTVMLFDGDGEKLNSYTVIVCGDVDGDGRVTVNDYASVKARFKSNEPSFGGVFAKAADVNGDGKYTTTDYIAIKRYVSGKYIFSSVG